MSGYSGSDPAVEWQVAPTGGIVILKLHSAAPAASWSLVRNVVSGGASVQPVTLFNAPAEPPVVFVDIGDGTKAALDQTLTYQYTFTTAAGTVQTDLIQPATSIKLEPDRLTPIILRGLQSGVRSLTIPAAFRDRPSVFYAMPMGSQPTLPMITLNDTLIQQDQIPIGQNNPNNVLDNTLIIGGLALRHYTIAVLTLTAEERAYYRDAVLAIFHSILGPIMQALGENATHRFQVHSSQVTGDGMQPGFYYSEILLEITGNFTIGVSTEYGVIAQITGEDEYGQLFLDT